jgi:large subunit ribosomal protein L46
VGAVEGEIEDVKEKLLVDEQPFRDEDELDKGLVVQEKVELVKPMPRVTEADQAGDEKSLNRLLQRTLYLLVKDAKGAWQFPTASWDAVKKESLREVGDICYCLNFG